MHRLITGEAGRRIDINSTPLVVDLDGTLVRSNLFIESVFALVGKSPTLLFYGMFTLLSRGKAKFKEFVAAHISIEPSKLPYNEAVLQYIRTEREKGRSVMLVSENDQTLVGAVADHLQLFDGWLASDGVTNLKKREKASRLVKEFTNGGFDFVGHSEADLPVWKVCSKRIAVGASQNLRKTLIAIDSSTLFLSTRESYLKIWPRAMRIHQYAKNGLVFVPLLTAHKFEITAIINAVFAATSFSLCASSVYVFNDLVDLTADRRHPTKCQRPFAAGLLPAELGVIAIPLLLVSGLTLAVAVSWPLLAVLLAYVVLSTTYTVTLKRKMFVDAIVLAMLYAIRVIGGAISINAAISEWLLAFSIFIFVALALIKRYVELAMRVDADLPDPGNRNYLKSDLSIVGTLAAASGFNAVTIFALYISSDAVHQVYTRPQLLWLICPILMYWIARMLLLAHRRLIVDDPVAFALGYRNSLAAVILVLAIVLAAI